MSGAQPDPRQLLMTAHRVMERDDAVFDGCWAVTAAALTRQAIELTLEARLAELGVADRISKKAGFLRLAAADDNPDAVRRIHHAWAQLSDACHGTSYELPPSHDTVQAWIRTAAGFIGG